MKIFFRVDASTHMGIGHLMRCLTLAEALRERGANIRFICREHAGHLIELLRQKAMMVTVLPSDKVLQSESHNEDYSKWLGVTQSEDAVQTIEVLNDEKPDWLIVDHYGLDINWEKQIRPYTKKIMVIDDLANRQHICDILLDQNYSDDKELRYTGLVPDKCKLLIGPRYALIRSEFSTYRKTLDVRRSDVNRVIVFFGGTDPHNMTGLALDALSSSDLSYLHVDVIVGSNNPHYKSIEKKITNRPHTILYKPRPHLADLMTKVDLAIGAGGVTTWERMCLGLPTIVISIAENQRPASEALKNSQLIHYAGHYSEIKVEQLTKEIKNLCHDFDKLKTLSVLNKFMVDGHGTSRIVEVLCPSVDSDIRLRPACEEDVYYYINWSNEFRNPKAENKESLNIWSAYHSWFTNKLHDLNVSMFVLEVRDLPVGQILFEEKDNDKCINYELDTIIKERGWDSLLVAKSSKLLQEIEPVRLIDVNKKNKKRNRTIFLRMDDTNKSDDQVSFAGYSISILSDENSWMNEYIQELQLQWLDLGHRIQWEHNKNDLDSGDICFYLSCGQIVSEESLSKYKHNLVVHESDLPLGKGWSPLTWQIIEGKNLIPVTLLEAEDKVDSGAIYLQEWLEFQGDELISELHEAQAIATLNLCKKFVADYPNIIYTAIQQTGDDSFYSRRIEDDSRLNPNQSIEEQFDLLRVVDNERYPAFFDIRNNRYLLKIERVEK